MQFGAGGPASCALAPPPPRSGPPPLIYSLGVAGALPVAFALWAGGPAWSAVLSAQIRRCGAG
jgi:hypothetical protein